jgi:hypothetical protein
MSDADYHAARAERELEAEADACNITAARVHGELAELHRLEALRRERPKLKIATKQ